MNSEPAEKIVDFNKLLLGLATRLISTSFNEVGPEIARGLRLTGEFWGLDHIALFKATDRAGKIACIRSYLAPGVDAGFLVYDATSSWFAETISRGRTVALCTASGRYIQNALLDRQICIRAGPKIDPHSSTQDKRYSLGCHGVRIRSCVPHLARRTRRTAPLPG